MDPLRAASSRARLLLAIADAQRDCELWLDLHVRLRIVRGRAESIVGADLPLLGDTLVALGALDPRDAGLLASAGEARIGARLVASGVVTERAVRRALEAQLVRGVEALLRAPAKGLRHGESSSAPSAEVSVDLSAAVWAALFRIACELPEGVRARIAGEGALALTEFGERRVQGLLRAAHAGELDAVLALSPRPASCHQVGPSPDAITSALSARAAPDCAALRAILRVLGAAVEERGREDAYALLLRKRRELARNASASALLDLSGPVSPDGARRALRRLAQKLHPDRFARADGRLIAVSNEVMRALSHAATSLCERAGSRSTL